MTNTPDQPIKYGPDDIALYKRLHAPAHTDDELKAFFAQVERTQLDPFARQIYTVKRWNSAQKREAAMTQVSIDGLRIQAERSGRYAGQSGPWWCGAEGLWVDVWTRPMSELVAARVGVFRAGWSEPVWGVARFDAYAQRTKEGKLSSMWASMGDVMIAKCAEALALRKACPAELSGLYATEEMMQADAAPAETKEEPKPPVQRPAPPVAAPKADPKPAKAEAKPAAPVPAAQTATDAERLAANTNAEAELKAEIAEWMTIEKANAGIPVILAMAEPDRSIAQAIFKAHRLKQRWEIGTIDGALQVRPLEIREWNTIERAQSGLSILEAMPDDEKAEAIEILKGVCHENGWTLKTAPKLSVGKGR